MIPEVDPAGPAHFTADALARFLIAPDAGERLAPLVSAPGASRTRGEARTEPRGPGVLVLDLAASTSEACERFGEALLEQLPLLPCVTIALGANGGDQAGRLRATCDVALESADEVDRVWRGVVRAPIAALAFAQLLRDASARSIYGALVAESFVYSTLQAGAEFRAWLAARKRRPSGRKRSPVEAGPACRMERDRDRLEVRLARPDKHNAFSRAMRDGLTEALQLALADPSIETLVLLGEGPSFCSGGDLDEFGSFPDPAEAHAIRTTRSPALLLSRLAQRTRVEVHGACIGAGAELPAFAKHVVAREDAFFQLPEVALGLVPGAGGTASLPRRIGRQRTAWLGLSGARIDARTALDWGLVDEVRLAHHVGPGRSRSG